MMTTGNVWRVLFHGIVGKTRAPYIGISSHPPKRPPEPSVYATNIVWPNTEFDELVISDWLHVEQQNDRDWWIGISHSDGTETHINVRVGKSGRAAKVTIEENL